VTSLPPARLENVRWEPPVPDSFWIRRQVAENLPEPLSTLFEELYLREGLERSLDELMAFFRMPWFHLEDIADRPFFTTVNGFAYQRARFKFGWKTMPIALRGAFDGWRVMFSDAESFWRDRALPAYLASVERWKTLDPAVLTNERLLAGVRELALADATYWYACAVVVAAAKMTDALLDRFLALVAPRRQLTSGLFLRGFASRSMAAQADLEALADRIMRSDGLPELVAATPAERLRQALAGSLQGVLAIEELDSYLDKYGHQIYNLDFAEPTQADDPIPVLLSLRALVARPGRDLANRQQDLAIQRKHLTAATARSFDPVRRLLFHKLLIWAERFGPHREEALFFMGTGWPTLRRLALELGKRGVAVGALDCADDVFHLESAEIAQALDPHSSNDVRAGFSTLAQERRELRQARRRLHPPAAVPPSRGLRFGPLNLAGFETQHRNTLKGQLLRGFAVSPGKAVAEASLILSPSDFGCIQPDTILVCPTTTPAWTPLFSQARGLVTDIGGILAHGSIVAREYGIPAVMGTGNGTERIIHVQLIGVDGDRGEVDLAPAGHVRG
jgi:pyruvate,water dikinase